MANRTKQCPFCGEDINLTAKKCKFCGEWFEEQQYNRIRCPYCHILVPQFAEKCPSCGEWIKDEHTEYFVGLGFDNPITKCINILFIIISVIVLLAGLDEPSILAIGIPAVIFMYIATYVYMLPSIFAASRNHPQLMPIVFINVLFGETIIGWIGAMIWANTHRIGRHTHW